MRVLVVTKIFPNAVEPLSAPFNRQQLAALGRRCDVEVLATIPWFPGAGAFSRWSSAGKLSAVPRHDWIDGLAVAHPAGARTCRASATRCRARSTRRRCCRICCSGAASST